ncbi:brain and acute leukemia cytoplasmic protein [Aplochiton taeniatus]
MGCGGSRADTIIEPRYHESWTRETESTWLTNTDIETPLPASNSKGLEGSLKEKRMVNTGTQCGKQPLPTAGSNYQRRSRRSCNEPTRDSKRRSSKEANCPSKELPAVNSCAGEPAPHQDCDDR